MKTVKRPLLSLFLLVLFSLLQVNTLLFIHVHEVDGVSLYHSHLNTGQHDHTTSELLLIGLLGHVEASSLAIGKDFIHLMPRYCKLRVYRSIPVLVCQVLQGRLLRAPPFSSLFN